MEIAHIKEPEPLELETDRKFWKVDADKNGNFIRFKIDRLKFLKVMAFLGFARLDVDKAHLFVQVYDHRIVREVTETHMEDNFFDYLKEKHADKPLAQAAGPIYVESLINQLLGSRAGYFNKEFLYRLKPSEKIIFNTDTRHSKFIYYKNGFAEITATGITFLPYEKLQHHIWENEILKRDFVSHTFDKCSVFENFCRLVAGNENPTRFDALKTIIGYNLHSYFDTKLKCTAFTDSRISQDDEPNGRTGKTLLCKGVAQMLSCNPDNASISTYCEINGKDFDPQAATKYQSCGLDTRLVVINDARRFFDVEILFNDITEGLMVKRLYQPPFRIRAKIILTTNKTLRIEGDSSKDRFIEFEFSEYFHKAHTPEKEFGHWFFRDWDKREWNRFDAFMQHCVQFYLEKGLLQPKEINLLARKLRENTGQEFLDFMESATVQEKIKGSITENIHPLKTELFEAFRTNYPEFARDHKFKQSRFSRWITCWARYNSEGVTCEDKNTAEGRVYIFKQKPKT